MDETGRITDAFKELVNVAQLLLGPFGCPWDRAQTLDSLRKTVLEEVHEVIEAIDANDGHKIQEELGDLFFNALLLSLIAEKEGKTSPVAILQTLTEKLIRRHPHVFKGSLMPKNDEEALAQWEKIKKEEHHNIDRKSVLDGIPKGLPSLAKAQKMISKLLKTNFLASLSLTETNNEEKIAKDLWDVVLKAKELDVDVEHALSRLLTQIEQKVRHNERIN